MPKLLGHMNNHNPLRMEDHTDLGKHNLLIQVLQSIRNCIVLDKEDHKEGNHTHKVLVHNNRNLDRKNLADNHRMELALGLVLGLE